MADDELEQLLAEQVAYYRARAGEYDARYPLDVHADAGARAQLLTALEALAPYGRALELACGTGQWTVELARHAVTATAVDAAPEALAICRRRVGAAHVRLVEADLFTWRPRERYDFVFFSAWLSHVPPQRCGLSPTQGSRRGRAMLLNVATPELPMHPMFLRSGRVPRPSRCDRSRRRPGSLRE